jgi:hypothetical protein
MFRVFANSVAVSAVALSMTACGGGSGSSSTPASSASGLTVSGVAATGAALADSGVTVKCATGEGRTQTSSSGNYSLTVAGGALPCMVEVKGMVEGTELTLHSVTEAGTRANGQTAAVANVTPLTEMIVAKLAGAMPAEVFAAFSAQTSIQSSQVAAATAAVVAELKTSTGIDLGTIDPFKSVLVPATASAPNAGNAHDRLLDQLKAKVPTEALALVVNQIANASSAAGAAVGEAQPTLADVMAGVAAGSLVNCPTAMSGKYRTIDYFGRVRVRQFDFKALEVKTADGVKMYDIVPHPTQACRFTAAGTYDGVNASWDVVMGAAGAGAYYVQNITAGGSTLGYIFPLQVRPAADFVGEWSVLQSGYSPFDSGTGGEFAHALSKAKFEAAGQFSVCDYDFDQQTCVADTGAEEVWSANENGGFKIGTTAAAPVFYVYRAPNGVTTLFGSTNPTGAAPGAAVEATHFVATKLSKLTLPAVNSVSGFWSVRQGRVQVGQAWASRATEITSDSVTVQSVDAATSTVTRQRASDQASDTVQFNQPIDGLRLVPPASGSGGGAAQMVLTGLGITATVNNDPAVAPNFAGHFYSISVARK